MRECVGMATYQFRFLRPDDSYVKKVRECEFASDREAQLFVLETYPQRAIEIWSGKRLVLRRVSPGHEARLRGWYRRSCRYPAMSNSQLERLDRDFGEMPFADFEMLGRYSQSVFNELRAQLASHSIWIRAASYLPAPPAVDQHIRFSFSIIGSIANRWHGTSNCTVWSRERDGRDVFDDVMDAAPAALSVAHTKAGIETRPMLAGNHGKVVRDGLFLAGGVSEAWEIDSVGGKGI